MAVIGISPSPLSSQQQQQQKQQQQAPESDMDKVFKALQIANTGFGIAVNYQKFTNRDAIKEQNEAEMRLKNSQADKIDKENLLIPSKAEKLTEDTAKAATELRDKNYKDVGELRQRWLTNQVTKTSQAAFVAYKKAVELTTGKPSPLKDQAAIISYYQTIEPGLQVKGDERAAVEAARTLDQRFVGAFQKVLRGEPLTDPQRKDIQRASKILWDQQKTSQDTFDGETRRLATERGLDPNQAVLNLF